LKVKVFEVH
jgi:hypothetical protein